MRKVGTSASNNAEGFVVANQEELDEACPLSKPEDKEEESEKDED